MACLRLTPDTSTPKTTTTTNNNIKNDDTLHIRFTNCTLHKSSVCIKVTEYKVVYESPNDHQIEG